IINFKHDPLLQPLHQLEAFRKLAQTCFPTQPLLRIHKQKKRASVALSLEEAKHYTELLLSAMEVDQPYLKPDLGLKELAEKISLHPNKLSWLLNDRIGQNFYEFVNRFRLKAFQQKALEPQNQHLSLLGLAYESGFNSKTVFNTYFKKAEGVTPAAYRKKMMQE
ncbi:MAG: helix-turn-helix domain-containing protein, partial [Bacteroidota bacterium]